MAKVKEKVTLLLSLLSVGMVRTTEVKSVVVTPEDTGGKSAVQTRFNVVESFIRTTDGQAARNKALT